MLRCFGAMIPQFILTYQCTNIPGRLPYICPQIHLLHGLTSPLPLPTFTFSATPAKTLLSVGFQILQSCNPTSSLCSSESYTSLPIPYFLLTGHREANLSPQASPPKFPDPRLRQKQPKPRVPVIRLAYLENGDPYRIGSWRRSHLAEYTSSSLPMAQRSSVASRRCRSSSLS